ncbi:ARM repeat-containing protein [Xylariaceae sp. FL0016]|nr:ARM repeat-containing protein [Xylariaceae sp. FL0016]
MTSNPSLARTDFFKELKPPCVAINNLTVRSTDKKASAKDLIKVTEELSATLDRHVAQDASALDEKLADYVFFPLSNILRNQQEYPVRLTELTLRCLRTLISHGWKAKLSKELLQQLLIFLTFIIGGVPGRDTKDRIPEETELEAFKALTSLIKAAGLSSTGSAALVQADNIPSLGHAVTVVVEAITDARNPDIQIEALQTLDVLLTTIRDQSALATFLPGIVSSLSRLLTPPTAWKIQKRILVRGIKALQDVLTKVLGDIKTMVVLNKPSRNKDDEKAEGQMLTPSWLKATTAKVKLALAGVLKLRSHDAEVVRSTLEKLCITLLDECHQSLAECSSIFVETAIILSSGDEHKSVYETSLVDLARIYPELADTIKNAVYNWVTSLPRIVQSSDEKTKQQAFMNLLKGQSLVTTLQIDSSVLENTLASSLRDSATALALTSKSGTGLSEISRQTLESGNMDLANEEGGSNFRPVMVAQDTERLTRSAFLEFLSWFGTGDQQVKLASDMLNYVHESNGPSQVASYWLAFELIKTTSAQSSEVDEFLDLSSAADASDDNESLLQELYSFSVTVLDSQAEAEGDWRMQALALEVTTFAASRMRENFRPELIDVLYPIATFLGAEVPQLREHAIVSLNSIALSCGYTNVTELIIDNVDYMVNSVSLRLNTFDISPASTQVLRMMIRLTGPKLLPYLDDVVASVFAALDNYHGYTIFAESLFGVLTEVVQQGIKSDKLLIEHNPILAPSHEKTAPATVTTNEICSIIDARRDRKRKRQQEELDQDHIESHPQLPWKESNTSEQPGDGEGEEGDEATSGEVEKPPPPKSPTYQLLTRITDLTQHYLTSPTPTLRKSLLDLLAIVCPALSPDEDVFLPLVNSVWPVVVARLYDGEPFVVVSACATLSALCRSAGDFLGSRFKTEWWDGLGKWCTKVKANAIGSRSKGKGSMRAYAGDGKKRGIMIPIRQRDGFGLEGKESTDKELQVSSSVGAGLGRFTQAAQIWEAAQSLLVALVTHVQVDAEIFDQILVLLAESLGTHPDVRAALEVVDADAVWLVMYERGVVHPFERPEMNEVMFVNA